MEEHPPLFSPEELNGLPTLPAAAHENIVPFPVHAASSEVPPPPAIPETLVSVFNPAEMVLHPAPENTELSYAEALAKYKEMVGVKPDPELSEAAVRNAITSLENAEAENRRIRDKEALEHAEELAEQSKGWR